MERISIKNFAGIESIFIDIKSINILIGPQGSGKSVIVKLLFFFKNFFSDIVRSVESEESKRDLDKRQKEKFTTFFPKDSWPDEDFEILYFINDVEIYLKKTSNQLKFSYSNNLKLTINKIRKIYSDENQNVDMGIKRSTLNQRKEIRSKIERCLSKDISGVATYNQYFIPAGRSFFANIQKSIFSFLSDNRSLDPFLVEFGVYYENFKHFYGGNFYDKADDKRFDEIVSSILNSSFTKEKDKEYLIHSDNRRVNLSNASSGQQEILPLIVILKILNNLQFSGSSLGTTIYIEEPEAHLFPIAQKAIVQLLARTFNNQNREFQIIVTTHSPYILSSFNNLLEAGMLVKKKPEQSKNISKIVPAKEQIDPGLVTSYSLSNGQIESLIDADSGLIKPTILDGISNEIALEFGGLLDIEF